MLGNYTVATQLVASRVVLRSIELVGFYEFAPNSVGTAGSTPRKNGRGQRSPPPCYAKVEYEELPLHVPYAFMIWYQLRTRELHFSLSQSSSVGTEQIQEVMPSLGTERMAIRMVTIQLLCSMHVTFRSHPQKNDSSRMINRT
jgi:hypothetical protein